MIKGLLSIYRLNFPTIVVYMLQATEYDTKAYLKWFWEVLDFDKVMHRRELVETTPARFLLAALRLGIAVQLILGIYLGVHSWHLHHSWIGLFIVALFILSTPVVWGNLIVLPLVLGRWFIIKPSNWFKIRASAKIFANHPGTKIAIAGSYGKTTMKEILHTVLSEAKKVAATPANKNVAISHALFARKLKGDEDILIIEYGEGAPGDVARFSKITHPDIAVITGLAPAHLDKYKTLKRAAEDIFSVTKYVGEANSYVNGDSEEIKNFSEKLNNVYDSGGLENWKVKNLKLSIEGLSFELSDPEHTMKIKNRLLGKHQVGPLVLAAVLAHKLGLSTKQIEQGIAKVEPFEHRMKPYQLSGAWIIDDTYNGNIEGVKAGLELLKTLSAKRRIYVTPGLVDQGGEEAEIHRQLGRSISQASPDQVVLMKHSVTDSIIEGMEGYKGQLIVEDDPLSFYTHLDKFVAAGDLVLMQNDWPDNYN